MKIVLNAIHGDLKDGYTALDDFEFLFDSVECPTRPEEPITTTPSPDNCPGQLKCGNGDGCYSPVKER